MTCAQLDMATQCSECGIPTPPRTDTPPPPTTEGTTSSTEDAASCDGIPTPPGDSECSSSSSSSSSTSGSINHVTITVSELNVNDKHRRHMLYQVQTTADNITMEMEKKYTDFQHLHDKLKKMYTDCEAADMKLPGKKLFAHRDPTYLAHRLQVLQQWMEKIASDSSVLADPIIKRFLGLPNIVDIQCSQDSSDAVSLDLQKDDHGDVTNLDLGPSEKEHCTPSDFEFLHVLGKGSFGKVFLAKHHEEGQYYAVKVVSKSLVIKRNETRHIMSERNVLVQNIKHPFLIGLHYSFQTATRLYFVMDYVNGGELFYHLQREGTFEESRARFYAAEITSALGYLHSHNIIYRDLKPENVLLDKRGHIVLTDFGLCKEGIEGSMTTATFCGTPEYLAPEILLKQPYDKLVDWWCLGAVLYEMIFGMPPFYSRDLQEMYTFILHKPLIFTGKASTVVKHLLQQLLSRTRKNRLGYHNDAQDVKAHAFFHSIKWNLLQERKIKPPFSPKVKGTFDLHNFDPEFTDDSVSESIVRSVSSPNLRKYSSGDEDGPFHGFSYILHTPDESYHA